MAYDQAALDALAKKYGFESWEAWRASDPLKSSQYADAYGLDTTAPAVQKNIAYTGNKAYEVAPDGTKTPRPDLDTPATAPTINVAAPRVPAGQLTQEQVSAIPGIKQEGPGQYIFPLGDGNWQRLRVNDYDAGRFDYFNAPFKPAAGSGTANTYSRQTTGGKTYVIHNQSQKVAAEIVNGQTIPRNGYTFAGNALVPPGSAPATGSTAPAAPAAQQTAQQYEQIGNTPSVVGTGRNYGFETPGGGSGSTRVEGNVSVGESSGTEYKDPWVDPNIAGNKIQDQTSSRGRIQQLQELGYFDLPNPNAREPMVSTPPVPMTAEQIAALANVVPPAPVPPEEEEIPGGAMNAATGGDILTGPSAGRLNYYEQMGRTSRPMAGNPDAYVQRGNPNASQDNQQRSPYYWLLQELRQRNPGLYNTYQRYGRFGGGDPARLSMPHSSMPFPGPADGLGGGGAGFPGMPIGNNGRGRQGNGPPPGRPPLSGDDTRYGLSSPLSQDAYPGSPWGEYVPFNMAQGGQMVTGNEPMTVVGDQTGDAYARIGEMNALTGQPTREMLNVAPLEPSVPMQSMPPTAFSQLLETLMGPRRKKGRAPALRPAGSTMMGAGMGGGYAA